MPVLALDHINVRTRDPAATMAFLQSVLGMRVTNPMGGEDVTRGGWVLDDTGAAIIHVASADAVFPGDAHRPFTPASGSGAIHHVALRCSDHAGTIARLQALGIPYWENAVPRANLRQIFVEEPTGILLELGFSGN